MLSKKLRLETREIVILNTMGNCQKLKKLGLCNKTLDAVAILQTLLALSCHAKATINAFRSIADCSLKSRILTFN